MSHAPHTVALRGVRGRCRRDRGPRSASRAHLFVGFTDGSCVPRGDDHDASLFAATLPLDGKKCGAGGWRLSAPGLGLASSQLAGNLALLGSDAPSGRAWGTWVMGAVGGGPPYTQLHTQMSFEAGAPAVDWTCRTPRTAIGVPTFDARVDAGAPLFFTNGSFAVFGGPGAAPPAVGGYAGDGSAQLLDVLERSSAGAFRRHRRDGGGAPRSAPAAASALQAEDIPLCAMRELGAFALPAPGVQQAVVFDKSLPKPCAATVTLSLAAGGVGRVVTVQRLSVATGKPTGAPTLLPCPLCADYLYQPITLSNNALLISTINYTTSVITSFSARLSGGSPPSLAVVPGSPAFILRESDVVALPAPGAGAPYPLGLAALQTTSPTDNWACHNRSTARTVRVGAVARPGARLGVAKTCSVPVCALGTDAGGCIIPQFGFA